MYGCNVVWISKIPVLIVLPVSMVLPVFFVFLCKAVMDGLLPWLKNPCKRYTLRTRTLLLNWMKDVLAQFRWSSHVFESAVRLVDAGEIGRAHV